MSLFDTHVCLVSAQAAPNLLPLLDEELKPQQVILMVTPEMQQRGQWLAEVIRPRGIAVKTWPIEAAADFAAIQEVLLDVLGEAGPERTALNVTGGTKWMAIAAQEVFRTNNAPVFYVDAQADRVHFLDSQQAPHALTRQIRLENYLQAYGYSVLQQDPANLPPGLLDLCEALVLRVREWQGAIGYLNQLAAQASGNDQLQARRCDPSEEPPAFAPLLAECRQAGLFRASEGTTLVFADAQAREFCNGGWLEAYVGRLLAQLRGDGVLQDTPMRNVVVQAQSGTKNEIDVAFMARNRLHLIECKTGRQAGKHAAGVGTETVYKLDSISDLGGLGTRAMLVSYRNLSPADRTRARDLRIKVVEGDNIQQLKNTLRQWIAMP